MSAMLIESTVEDALLEWAAAVEYAVVHGPDIVPSEPAAERANYGDVLLVGRLKEGIARLPTLLSGDWR